MNQSDRNASEIVTALRAAGATVRYVEFQFGQAGCPDLLVGRAGVTYLLEVKTKGGRLSAPQQAFALEWRGGLVRVVRSAAEALQAVGLETNGGEI